MIPLNDSNGILNGSNGVNLSVQAGDKSLCNRYDN